MAQFLAHNVYFTLNDPSDTPKLVASCKKYLTDHPGSVFFSCGTLAHDYKRSVNDRDFHVALQIVFDSPGSHDAYQSAPRHEDFIKENRGRWKKVRVFDSVVEQG